MKKNSFKNGKPDLKILLLTWEYPPNMVGGLSRHVQGLSSHLASVGVEVHVLTAGSNDLPEYENTKGVHIHRVRPLNESDSQFLRWVAGLNLAMVKKAADLAAEISFKAIHVHDWLTGAAGIAIKEVLGLPLLATIHATEHGRNSGIYNEIQRSIHKQEEYLIHEADQLIVCSDYMREQLLTIFPVKEEKITIIPNGIDSPKLKIEEQMPLSQKSGRKLIFSVGRIVPEKGFATIIEAAALAKTVNAPFFFLIAGKGPMLETYRRFIAEKNLEDYAAFIGYISDEEKDAYYRDCDAAIFPSLYEPFGIVALESMSHGKATVASSVGGLQSIIHHMKTGLLAAPGDAADLFDKVSFLLNNPAEATEIGLQGRKLVESLYGWKRIAIETKRIMNDMVLKTQIDSNELETENKILK